MGKIYSLLIIFFIYLIFIFDNRGLLFKKFSQETVNTYLKSQDIYDKGGDIKDRVFVSDETVYLASGYLYAKGSDPRDYNFQHPPFVKYLFGLSSTVFNLPLLPNIFLGWALLLEVYLLASLVTKKEIAGLFTSALILIDPVFKEVVVYALLDLGQIVFILGFLITTIYYEKHFLLSGILLGLGLSSKFYSPVFIFLAVVYVYKLINKKLIVKREIYTLIVAGLIFYLTYAVSVINDKGFFNIFFQQAKIIKFMIVHNKALQIGGVLPMFFGGYLLWPISFAASLFSLYKDKFKSFVSFLILIPVLYTVVMFFQIPFTRYFILTLPILYISLSSLILKNHR